MNIRFGVLLALMSLSTLAGCADDGPIMVPVTGKVTLKGEPIPDGDIVLRPAEGVGHAAGGKIKDGEFSFDSTLGKKKIEITARREKPGAAPLKQYADSGEGGPVLEQYIPKNYNDASTLTAEVTEAGPNELNFELK